MNKSTWAMQYYACACARLGVGRTLRARERSDDNAQVPYLWLGGSLTLIAGVMAKGEGGERGCGKSDGMEDFFTKGVSLYGGKV